MYSDYIQYHNGYISDIQLKQRIVDNLNLLTFSYFTLLAKIKIYI